MALKNQARQKNATSTRKTEPACKGLPAALVCGATPVAKLQAINALLGSRPAQETWGVVAHWMLFLAKRLPPGVDTLCRHTVSSKHRLAALNRSVNHKPGRVEFVASAQICRSIGNFARQFGTAIR